MEDISRSEALAALEAAEAAYRARNAQSIYINMKELTDWLVERYGASTGVVNATIFEILEKLGEMEKVTIGGDQLCA